MPKASPKASPKAGSPYRGAGVSFGGIWTDPSVGLRLPNGDSLYFKLEGKGWRSLRGHPRLRLSYELSRVNGTVDRHSVMLHHTTNSLAQQQNNAKKLNQALDYL